MYITVSEIFTVNIPKRSYSKAEYDYWAHFNQL